MYKNTPNYYAIVPASVRYDKNLTANAKLLYGELTALTQREGYCWANNKYFAELYSVTERSITEWLSSLEKLGHIKIEIVRGGRRILLGGVEENFYGGRRKLLPKTGVKSKKDVEVEPYFNGENPSNITSSITYKMKTSENDVFPPLYDDIKEVKIDEYGMPIQEIKKESKPPQSSANNKLALKIRSKFLEMCSSRLGVKPIPDVKGYKMVLFALNTAKLSESQIYDLFDEWFDLPKSDEDLISITKALSARQIEQYKIRNDVK